MRKFSHWFVLIFGILLFNSPVIADELELQKVVDDVYVIVGSLGNRTPGNLGNNATFGFIVTSSGVVVIDPGGTYKGAQKLHELIKTVTDKAVVTVINTGGQDHRWLGNSYFRDLGAEIIANKRAVKDHAARQQDQFFMLGNLVGVEGLEGTVPVYANTTFDKAMQLVIGGTTLELHHEGQAHTPGDSFVWLPQQQVMFTGDIVYTERMLGILDHSNSKTWLEAFRRMSSYKPGYIVPGHGHPTSLGKATADTYEYLIFLRKAVAEFMEAGGDISDIRQIDQSSYRYLLNYETLSGRNAQSVYSELEWE